MALLGIKSKKQAYFWVYFSLATATACLVYALATNTPFGFVFCLGFLFAAAWYYYAIKWVDRNATWRS